MNKIKRGWQFWIEDFGDYVIKTPKSKKEVSEKLKEYFRASKSNELDKRVNKIMQDIEKSTKLLKRSKIPDSFLADLEFLDKKKIKQKKVKVLEQELEELYKKGKIKESKDLIEKLIKFLIKLWEYGLHESTYKFYSNFGVFDGKIVLIDPFELMGQKEKVKAQIRKRKWHKPKRYEKKEFKEIFVYFEKEMDNHMNLKNLDKHWKKARK